MAHHKSLKPVKVVSCAATLRFIPFVCVVFLMALMVRPARATQPSGDGTFGEPYQIADLDDLKWLSENPDEWVAGKYFEQTDDIDASDTSDWNGGEGFTPIGTWDDPDSDPDNRFKGHYDGQGFEIEGLYIDRPGEPNQGLFGHVGDDEEETVIRRLHLVDTDVVGGRGTGTLIGRVTGNSNTLIEYCSSDGGSVEGDGAVGGLIGSFNSQRETPGGVDNPVLRFSYADVPVEWSGDGDGDKLGGLAGCSQKGTIQNSYARGSVTVDGGGTDSERIGGLAGCVEFRGRVEKSYSTGKVAASDSDRVGGLVGYLGAGGNEGVVEDSFWDEDTSKQDESAGGTGKETGDMKDASTFTGADWDFENVWDIDDDSEPENDGYPFLIDPDDSVAEWTGNTSSAWDEEGNWKDDVPTPSDSVTITDTTQNAPVIAPDEVVQIRNLHVGEDEDVSLTIQSDGTDSTGTLIVTGTSSGDVNVQRHLNGERWYIVGPPVTNQDISDFLQNENNDIPSKSIGDDEYYAVTTYSEAENRWKEDVGDNDDIEEVEYFTLDVKGNFDSGTGYLMGTSVTDTVTFTGSLTSANVNVSVTVSKPQYGWNSVGNPYTAPIGITGDAGSTQNFLDENEDNLFPEAQAIYVWDDVERNYKATNNSGLGFSGDLNANYIALGQGFLINSNADDGEGDYTYEGLITFTPDMRVAWDSEDAPPMLQSTGSEWAAVRVYATVNKGNEDEAFSSASIAFRDDMTSGLDPGYDAMAYKGNPDVAVYTRLVEEDASDSDFEIQALPRSAMKDVTVPVGLDTKGGGEVPVTFSFSQAYMPDDYTVELVDKTEGVEEEIASAEYTYSATVDAGDDGYGRFYLAFTKNDDPGEETGDGDDDGGDDGDDGDDGPDEDYGEIQLKINDADPGDTIEIESGTYDVSSPIEIDKQDLTLTAPEGAVLDAGGEKIAVIIEEEGVTVEGLTVENFTRAGIVAAGDNAYIADSIIDGADANLDEPENAGIVVHGAYGTQIVSNEIQDAAVGIMVRDAAAMTHISNNILTRNAFGLKSDDYEGSGIFPEDTRAINNSIYENNEAAEWAGGDDELDARLNWWGDRTGPAPDGDGNPVSENVAYAPWLGAEAAGGMTVNGTGTIEDVVGGLMAEVDAGAGHRINLTRTEGDTPDENVPGFSANASYVQVYALEKDGANEIIIRIAYRELVEESVYWYDGEEWVECSDVVWDQEDLPERFREAGYEGYAEVTIGADTTPGLDNFSGIVLAVSSEGGAGGGGGGDDDSDSSTCFIATAAYGSPMAGEVDALRALRDDVLLTTDTGEAAVKAYYRLSPQVADIIARSDGARALVRQMLRPAVLVSRGLFCEEGE